MRESTRLIATLIIWIALASVIGTALTSSTGAIQNADGVTLFGIVMVLTFAAMISTIAIWVGGWRAAALQARSESTTHTPSGKQKRLAREPLGEDRLARLIEQLDEEDIYDLETLLLARDSKLNVDGEIRQ